MFEFIVWNSPITINHKRNIHEIFGFAVHEFFDVQGYGVIGLRVYRVIVLWCYGLKALHVLELIWLWGYRYIEFSDFSKCFLTLGSNPDVLESNGLRIRVQREKLHGNIIVAFFVQEKQVFCGPVLLLEINTKSLQLSQWIYIVHYCQ